MKNKILSVIIIAIIAAFMTIGHERIKPAHTGMKVNLYGSEKGVDNVTEVTGAFWYFKPMTDIYQTPTYMQNAVWTADDREGSEYDESFSLTTKDGLAIGLDVSLNYRVESKDAVSIFIKYWLPLEDISATILRNRTRDAFNKAAGEFTAEQVYSKKDSFLTTADKYLHQELANEGFTIDKVSLLSRIRFPKSIEDGIKAKVNAGLLGLQKELELTQSIADAAKAKVIIDQKAYEKRTMADAERYEYEQKQKTLTSLIVQQQYIDKWNGDFGTGNVYGDGAMIYKQLK